MRCLNSKTLCVCLWLISGAATPVAAQEWAEKMFNKLDHNFGTVARGADTVYRFEITNLYKQTMQITGVRSSCGCTTPTIEHPTIKSHEKAYIVAKFNTRTFTGQHGATLTISIGPAPYRAEVQVQVHGNIRGDVVFSPGAVQFGNIDEGTEGEQLLVVDYAGRDNWRIVDVTNDNDYFEVELQERARRGRKVSYGLLVRLKDNAPAGYLKDQLTVVTSDSRTTNQRIPLFVEGHVVPEFSVTPPALVLGNVAAGEPITQKVIVRGKTPFRIVDVSCGNDCFTFQSDDSSKRIHFVEITFRPGKHRGSIKVPVRITTDRGPKRGATLIVSATVLDPVAAPQTQAKDFDADVKVRVAGTASK